jgi:hypothetical protein
MGRVPIVAKEVVQVAMPDALSVCEPEAQLIVAVPSLKVTVPVGTPVPGATAATVAVKVTVWLVRTAGADEVSVVVVAAGFTTWLSAVEVDARKADEPAYVAVMFRVATVAWLTMHVAVPELSTWLPPVHEMLVVPSVNVTVPAGVPEPGLTAETVAVYVTT